MRRGGSVPDTSAGRDRPWATIAAVLAAGLFSLGLTVRQAWQLGTLLHHAVHATGHVLVADAHPTIRFTDGGGNVVDFVQNGFISRPVGAAVPVIFDPLDPSATAQAATYWTTWGTALWMLPAGIVFTAGGLLEAVQKWRRRRGR